MKAVYIFLTLVVLLSLGLIAGSVDTINYDDLGLVAQIKNVPDADNGYLVLAYTQTEDFSFSSEDNVDAMIQKHIYQEVWDDKFVSDELVRGSKHIDSAIASISANYKYFKIPSSNDFAAFPNYQSIVTISRLIILKSMYDAKNGNLDEAIEYARYAAIFAQRIKTESNTILLSHMIGLAMQYESFTWLNHLVVNYPLIDTQHKNILNIFDHIPSYHEDSFPLVFAGEFIFAKGMVEMIVDRPFHERWRDYWSSQDWWNTDLDDEVGGEARTVKEEVYYLLQALFQKYYLHKNSLLNESAKYYSIMSQEALGYCNSVSLPENGDVSVRLIDLVKPNSATDYWVGNSSIFKEYYIRRCLGHVQIESVKAIAAILSYKNDNNKIPESLDELVPRYLVSVPVDPFDGKDLKYASDQGFLYSVGKNGLDDGGSHASYFIKRCAQNDLCVDNPTFSLYPVVPFRDEYENEQCEAGEYLGKEF